MNPEINCIGPSILAVWILLASTSCRLSCDARIIAAIHSSKIQETHPIPSPNPMKNENQIAHQLFTNFPLSYSQFQPPLCTYPPPPHTVSPSSPLKPPPATVPSPSSPPYAKPEHAVWCVAKPTVPASIMQQALDYVCGADCKPISLNELCYQPDTVLAHASYAFNSYWQRTKRAGGTCDFGASAMLVTVDPSYDQCHFIYS